MKQILLYQPIMSFIAEEFITAINEAEDDIQIRVNSPGGSVFAGWGMAAALQESDKNITVKVDGYAASMAFYLLLFADNVEALDVSKFMIHRAVGNVESEDDRKLLDSVNATLKAKMLEKINAEAFESVSGVSIDAMFDAEERKDVWITAKQAKEIGLISKINRLTPTEQQAMGKMVASYEFEEEVTAIKDDEPTAKQVAELIKSFTEKI